MKTITILIGPTGTSTLETHGFAGSACQQASQFLEQALGTRLAEQRTAEFYQAQTSRQQNIQRS